jgi:hypothetical protein
LIFFAKKILVHDKKGADTFPADFADFFRRFPQIFQILFLKISVNLRKYRRNLRGNVSQPFLSCTEKKNQKSNLSLSTPSCGATESPNLICGSTTGFRFAENVSISE